MATVTKPIALDESFNTTEVTPRNIADVLAEGLSHITGRTASEVEYDNTDSGLTSDDVQGAIDELSERPTLPSVDIQTAVDEFETYNGGLLSSLKVALSPNQNLHGYSEPWVGGAGKNKLPLTLANIKSANTAGTWSDNVYTVYGMTYTVNTDDGENVTDIEANGTPSNIAQLSLNKTAFLSGSFIGNGCPSGGGIDKYRIRFAGGLNDNDYGSQTGVMTADPNVAINVYIRVDVGITADHLKFYPMLRLSTESDPTFAPYSNICPISGHTQVEVGDDGKNCLPNDATDQTVSGVAFKKNNNGSLTLNGQSTADWAGITLTSAKLLKAGTYTVSCPRVNGVDTRLIISYDGAEKVNTYNVDYKTFTLTEDKIISVRFVIRNSGVSFSNVTYYPMIELGSTATPYVPYNGYQVTVNLGGTYYSGTLDVVSGVLLPIRL